MTTPDTQELIEALEPFVRHGRALGAFSVDPGPFSVMTDKGHRDIPKEDFCRARKALSRARSADEQPTPPDDLVEEEARQRAVEVVAKIEMDREGYPLSRTQEEIYTDACETVNAVLQALSPHLSEREKIVAWLRRHHEGELSNNLHTQMAAKSFADAISRGDHISGEGR